MAIGSMGRNGQAGGGVRLVAARSVQPSPFHRATLRDGCSAYAVASYNISHQTYYPLQLLDAEEEYRKLVNDAVLFDPPVERPVEIAGPQAAAFVDRMLARDMRRCAPGQCRYVLLCDQAGRVLMDSIVLRLEENRYWLSGDLGWMRGLAAGLGMEVEVALADAAPLQVQGPKARQIMAALLGEQVAGLGFYRLARATLGDMELAITRTGWTGEFGYEVYLTDLTRGVELWDAILAAGRPFGLAATGTSEARRIEAGIPDTSREACPEHNPFEIGLGRLIDLEKELPYVGREALRRIHAQGISRKLVGYSAAERIDIDRGKAPWEGGRDTLPWPVCHSGEKVGKATCAVWSFALQRTIGYAMVPLALTAPGQELTVETPSGAIAATVTQVPFVDPEKTRMRPEKRRR